MRNLFVTILCFLSMNAYCQIFIGGNIKTYNRHSADTGWTKKELVLGILPYQKVTFDVSVNSRKQTVFITDTLGNILYAQSVKTGRFKYETKSSVSTLLMYDLADDKTILKESTGPVDDFHTTVYFGFHNGMHDAELRVTATLIPIKSNEENKHFVRFFYLGYSDLPILNYSMSLEKLDPLGVRNEPESHLGDQEENMVVDTQTYQMIKDFVYSKKQYLQKDTIGFRENHSKGCYKITVDYKEKYYLKWTNSVSFFKDLLTYMTNEKVNKATLLSLKNYYITQTTSMNNLI